MAARSLRLFLIFGILISLMSIHPGKVKASPEIAASVVMIAPSVCPSTGCAAGQSVDFKVDYDLGAYLPTLVPNVQICVYTPIIWSAYLFHISTIGDVSGANYTPGISYCSFDITPDGYNLLGGAAATLSTNQFGDGLNFGFRIGGSALGTGSVLVRVLEQTSSSVWTRSSQAFSSVKVVPTGASVFVANDAPNCGTNSPCYINSFQDLADGYGTGLKDAVMVPLNTAKQSLRAIEIADVVAKYGNPNSITDVGVGAQSAYTGVLGGIYNVLINLKDIKDEKFIDEMRNSCLELKTKAQKKLGEVLSFIENKL